MRSLLLVLLVMATFISCGDGPKTAGLEALTTRVVTLPDGRQIRAEVMINPAEVSRGMMFRDALPPDKGMLFIHDKPAPYRYWMYNVKAPLDIVFMDANRRVVEISDNTPPCTTTRPEDCPVYGGHHYEQFVLELRAGEAKRLGIQKDQLLTF